MKRTIKLMFTIFIILILLNVSISYAISNDTTQSLLEVNKQEISVGETLEITIYLSQIEWNKSKFTLFSDGDISGLYLKEEEEIEMETEQYDVTFEIDQSKLNLNRIVLYYEIPEEMSIGTTFTLHATIENMDGTETIETGKIWITIVENTKQDTIEENQSKQEELNKNTTEQKQVSPLQTGEKEGIQASLNSNKMGSENLSSNRTNDNRGNSEAEETLVYLGSHNNYLSTLSIQGYSLNKEFNKESSTYFVTVGTETTSIEIEAITEDENAIVCYSGTDDLKEGENKVLISVTAENGNVRNYRIYVTRES